MQIQIPILYCSFVIILLKILFRDFYQNSWDMSSSTSLSNASMISYSWYKNVIVNMYISLHIFAKILYIYRIIHKCILVFFLFQHYFLFSFFVFFFISLVFIIVLVVPDIMLYVLCFMYLWYKDMFHVYWICLCCVCGCVSIVSINEYLFIL